MANKNRFLGYFTFGLIIVVALLLSGILLSILEFVIGSIALLLFSMTYQELLVQPDVALFMGAIVLVLSALVVGVMTIGFVFTRLGFRRS